MGGKWPYSCRFVESCFQDLFNFIGVQIVQPYNSTDTATTWNYFLLGISVKQ